MTEVLYRIPLTNEPQRFDMDIGELSLTLTAVWNGELPAWELTALNVNTSEYLFTSLPLVTGTDLMSQFKHLGIDGILFTTTLGDTDAPPTLENMGIQAFLYYLLEQE